MRMGEEFESIVKQMGGGGVKFRSTIQEYIK